jgi:DNA-binding MarR family transcriptional regulator
MHVHAYGAGMAVRLQCYCASLRRATRVISQKYDAALAAADLTVTHFTLLTALQENPGARANDLVDVLAMDQTTLSRTFALMERDGLIARHEGEDLRAVHWKLTNTGRARLKRAEPHWKGAQESVKRLLGEQDVRRLTDSAFRLAEKLKT